MKYKKVKNIEEEISVIGFGCWGISGPEFWEGTTDESSIKTIQKAVENGINLFDVAPVYGFGHAEEILGTALKGMRHKVLIATKCGLVWDEQKRIKRNLTPKSIFKEIDDSLKRLKTDYIDLYQIHWPDSTTPIEESMEAMEKLKKEGKIRAIGVSNYSLEQFKKAVKSAEVVSNQLPFSMVDRHIEEDIIPYCLENGYAILAYSPLQRGLLTGKVTPDYKFKDDDHRKDNPFFTIENRKKVLLLIDKIRPIAESHGITVAQLVINWTVHHPGITAALVGTRNVKQAEENFDSLKVELSDEEMDQINKWVYQTNLEVSY